jgi:hypothetical protein
VVAWLYLSLSRLSAQAVCCCNGVTYAFNNIPPDRPTLQLNADKYRKCWDIDFLGKDDIASMPFKQRDLPVNLLVGVMRDYRASSLKTSPHDAGNKTVLLGAC